MTVNFNGKIDALYTDLNGKIEAINLHMKKLDTQVAQTAESVKRQEGFLPAKTEMNPRLHINAITVGNEEEGADLETAEVVSIDTGACRSTGSYAIVDASDRKSSVDRHNATADQHTAQTCEISSQSSPIAEERVYKPKPPIPRRTQRSKRELEDAGYKAVMDKIVEDFPLIDAERFSPSVRNYVERMYSRNLSPEQCDAMLVEEVDAVVQEMKLKRPAKPPLRELIKLESPGMFVVPCAIKGMELKNSLCDTGANVNVIAGDVARKLGIMDLRPSRMSILLADGTPTTSKGFIADLMLQVGDCLIPTDFHVMESRKGSNRPLILGRAFLATVGAFVDFPNERISFSKINKDVFYPAVHDKETSCMSVTEEGKPGLDPGDDMKKVQDVLKKTPPAAHHDTTKPARSKCKKIHCAPPSTLTLVQSDGVLTAHKVKCKKTSKPFSKFKIIIPEELREKGEEVVQRMVENTMKLLPGAVLWKSGAEKPPFARCSTDEGDPKPLKDPPHA